MKNKKLKYDSLKSMLFPNTSQGDSTDWASEIQVELNRVVTQVKLEAPYAIWPINPQYIPDALSLESPCSL